LQSILSTQQVFNHDYNFRYNLQTNWHV